MTSAYYVNCSKCGNSSDVQSCMRCDRGHVLCNSCLQSNYYLLTTTSQKCPKCNTGLRSATESFTPTTAFDDVKKEVYKKTWKATFWWWGYLFRNPEIVLSLLCLPFTLMLLLETKRNPSFMATLLEWLEGSLIASIAPIVILVFALRKRAGLGLINGWRTVWSRNLRAIGIMVGIVAALLMFHLLTAK